MRLIYKPSIALNWRKLKTASIAFRVPNRAFSRLNRDVSELADDPCCYLALCLFRKVESLRCSGAFKIPSCPASVKWLNHPDFRVGGKVFATLGYPDRKWCMVRLTPDQQEVFVADEPSVFVPAAGAWGRQGNTTVLLKAAKQSTLRRAILAAWLNTAPKALAKEFEAKPAR